MVGDGGTYGIFRMSSGLRRVREISLWARRKRNAFVDLVFDQGDVGDEGMFSRRREEGVFC